MKALLLIPFLAFAGCAEWGIQGTVFIVDPDSGAKGGLTATSDGTTFTGSYVDDDGNVVGGGSVFIPRKVVVIPEK